MDAASNVYVTSTTTSADFPVVGGFDMIWAGKDAVAANLIQTYLAYGVPILVGLEMKQGIQLKYLRLEIFLW